MKAEIKGKDKDLLKQLDKRQGVKGGMWKPECIGDTIMGQVLSMVAEVSDKFGKTQVKMILGTEDGAQSVYANWSMQQGLISEKVGVGDTIGIQYKADVPGRGRPMRAFAVVRKGGKGKMMSEALTKVMEADKKVAK